LTRWCTVLAGSTFTCKQLFCLLLCEVQTNTTMTLIVDFTAEGHEKIPETCVKTFYLYRHTMDTLLFACCTDVVMIQLQYDV
jgi:hypothetical protein